MKGCKRFRQISSLCTCLSTPKHHLPPSSHICKRMHFCLYLSPPVCLSDTHTSCLFSSSWQALLRGTSQLAIHYLSHKRLSIWVKPENTRPLRIGRHKMPTQNAKRLIWNCVCQSSLHRGGMCLWVLVLYGIGCIMSACVVHLWVYMCTYSCNKNPEPGATTESLTASRLHINNRAVLMLSSNNLWISSEKLLLGVAHHFMNHHKKKHVWRGQCGIA